MRFSRPSIDFAGDELLIAFTAAVDDGAFGPTGISHPNFILTRKLAGFRGLAENLKAPARGLLVAEESARRIMRYAYEESTGDWIAAGVFAEGTFDGRQITHPDTVHVSGGRVYVANSSIAPLGTFVFDRNGNYLNFYTNGNVDALLVVGDYLYSSDWFQRTLKRTDLATGEVTPWTLSGASVSAVRSMVALPDGTVAMASRGTYKVEQFKTDGTWVKTLIGEPTNALWQAVTFDATNNVLWAATNNQKYFGRYDLATGETTLYATDWTSAFDLKMYDGRLLAAVYEPGRIHELTFSGTNVYNKVVIGGTRYFGRFDVFEAPPMGLSIMFR